MVNINKLVIIAATLGVASIAIWVGYKMYLRTKFVDPGKGKAADPGGSSTTWFGGESTRAPGVGVKNIDFTLKGQETGVDLLTNTHTGRTIHIYCSRRKYEDNKYATVDRNKCTKWKVGTGAAGTKFESRKKTDVMQTAYRMTL